MPRTSTATILPLVDPRFTEQTQQDEYSWRKYAKAALVFAVPTVVFGALKMTGSFSAVSQWLFGDSDATNDLETEQALTVIGEDKNQVIAADPLARQEDDEDIIEVFSPAILREQRRDGLRFAEFKELPMRENAGRHLLNIAASGSASSGSSVPGTTSATSAPGNSGNASATAIIVSVVGVGGFVFTIVSAIFGYRYKIFKEYGHLVFKILKKFKQRWNITRLEKYCVDIDQGVISLAENLKARLEDTYCSFKILNDGKHSNFLSGSATVELRNSRKHKKISITDNILEELAVELKIIFDKQDDEKDKRITPDTIHIFLSSDDTAEKVKDFFVKLVKRRGSNYKLTDTSSDTSDSEDRADAEEEMAGRGSTAGINQRLADSIKTLKVESGGHIEQVGQKIMQPQPTTDQIEAERIKEIERQKRAFYGTPPQPPKDFTGQEQYLTQIREKLLIVQTDQVGEGEAGEAGEADQACRCRPVALTGISGLGGVGKTTLAAHIFHDDEALGGRFKFKGWIGAEHIREEYLRIGRDLGSKALGLPEEPKPADDDFIRKVKPYLERDENSGWLLVYDNAENKESLQDYLPQKNGCVLVTSRDSHWEDKVDINVMCEEDAIKLIKTLTGRVEETEKIKELVELLGRLPLALAQAGAYIKKWTISVADYIIKYEQEGPQKLLSYGRAKMVEGEIVKTVLLPDKHEKHDPVYVTWDISFDLIKELSINAMKILYACAYLHADDIPWLILIKYLEIEAIEDPRDELKDRIIPTLLDYSMVKVNTTAETFSIHRVVQDVLRHKAAQTTKPVTAGDGFAFSVYTLERLISVFCGLFRTEVKQDKRMWDVLPVLAEHLCEATRWSMDLGVLCCTMTQPPGPEDAVELSPCARIAAFLTTESKLRREMVRVGKERPAAPRSERIWLYETLWRELGWYSVNRRDTKSGGWDREGWIGRMYEWQLGLVRTVYVPNVHLDRCVCDRCKQEVEKFIAQWELEHQSQSNRPT